MRSSTSKMEAARHQRSGAVKEEVVGVGPVAAADGVYVAGALGHEQRRAGALALDQRVDGDGRAMDELRDIRQAQPARGDAVEYAVDKVARRGETLGRVQAPAVLVKGDQVGECSADIDCDEKQSSPSRL